MEYASCIGEVEKKWPDNTVRIGVFCMRQAFETAPRDGKVVILEDDASGTYDVAHWSAEAGEWVGENDEPSKIAPTHWYPYSHFPFSSSRAPPQRSAASDVIAPRSVAAAAPVTAEAFEAQTAPVEANATPHARRRFAASSITATLIAAALIGVYFRAEVAAYVTRYAGQHDIFRISTIGGQIVEQATRSLSLDLRKIYLLALQQQAEADQARAQAGVQETAQVKQAMEASAPQARQSLEKEQRPELLANELAEARRAIDGLHLQLRAGAANSAQLLEQERDKTAALLQEATAARQELTASTVQHSHALEEERARGAALASELVLARREIETNVALLSKARDDAAQFKQTAGRTTAGLQQERDRAEALSRELTMAHESAQHAIDTRTTLEPTANSQIAQVTPTVAAAAPEQPAATVSRGGPEVARLMVRASALLGQGNIGAARIVLERAAETGSAQASFMLAETYDPVILSTWGTYGTRGEATKARELYAKAHAGGIQEAKNRLDALDQ
jgi:hypothetical protein